ncbi:MAG TPA: helix-turn-helix domain-containing GNAT family N-acetyltransferase [Myxococcaceae bacterium]|nr:helix-turn-helix domain-containing GNAT family N-acetyltransferase [Myxococcaceae bacterium]
MFSATMGDLDKSVAAVRGFNRAYTRRFGLLDDQHLGSEYSLGEVRVLYELAHRDGPSAAGLARSLDLDPGHLSRMLAGLRRAGLVRRQRSSQDRRASVLGLTPAGRRAFDRLDRKATVHISGLLRKFPDAQRGELIRWLTGLRRLLEPREGAAPAVLIRNHRPGDLGWVLERHGAVYADEYGWGAPFEAVVARVIAEFAQGHDPAREACWVAELEGRRVGSVMLVRHAEREDVARLRLLLVEPEARGLGVGQALVDLCTEFARAAGYRQVTLWTQSVLAAARAIYSRAGYVKVSEAPNSTFGQGLTAETWELDL